MFIRATATNGNFSADNHHIFTLWLRVAREDYPYEVLLAGSWRLAAFFGRELTTGAVDILAIGDAVSDRDAVALEIFLKGLAIGFV